MRLTSSAVIIALVLLISFAFSVPRADDEGETLPLEEKSAPVVSVHDVYKKGVHTLSGSLHAPDACTRVLAEATLSEGQILLALMTEREPGVCLELPTPSPFETTIEAPADLPITVTVNGTSATASSP